MSCLTISLLFLLIISTTMSRMTVISLRLETLPLEGRISFDNTSHAARDFGNRFRFHPKAVLHPKSVSDIAITINQVWQMGQSSGLTVAARGCGHSLQGQSQAYHGVVIDMGSLQASPMQVVQAQAQAQQKQQPYVEVSGGELWINILQECLKYGLTPKSWTDYLHLSVGGTLSNAGISGQAFLHGPQISNVMQLEVVTGKGEIFNCSKEQNAELFYSVLGGLGQFGIITRARIALQSAPKMVKWIRVLYSDFDTFVRDQEQLISAKATFDYVEGFVIKNRTGLLNNWRTTFSPQDPVRASQFSSDGKTLFCLELAKYVFEDVDLADEEIRILLAQLNYIPSTLFIAGVSYIDFLDRVHFSEIKLRSKGLWDVPHPWLNLLIPKSNIHKFAEQVFGNILKDTSNGPILIYPVNRSKWDNRTSVMIPEEDIFYLVAFLSSAVPSSKGSDGLDHILSQNRRILDFCESRGLGIKQYLPHYSTQEEWKAHFGPKWEVIKQRKSTYDPLAILAPGQRIFQKSTLFS